MRLGRRAFLRSFALAGGGLWLPRRSRAAVPFGGFGIPYLQSTLGTPLATNIAAYWRLDAAPSSITPDATGAGNDLTVVGTGGIVAGGKINSAYQASSGTDVLSGVAAGTELAATDSFTLTAWVQPAVGFPSSSVFIAGRDDNTGALDYRLGWASGVGILAGFQASVTDTNGVVYGFGDGTTATDINNYTGGFTNLAWYFLAIGFDFALGQLWLQVNNGTRLALNGVLNVRNTQAKFGLANTVPGSNAMPGKIDEVGLWKRSLSTAEISTLYGAGSPPDYSTFASTVSRGAGAATALVTDNAVDNWATRVVTNGGAAPSTATKGRLKTMLNSLAMGGIYTKMRVLNPIEPGDLATALTPLLVGTGLDPWTNHSFVAGDVTANGITGNASTKYAQIGFNPLSVFGVSANSGLTVYAYNGSSTNINCGSDDSAHEFWMATKYTDGKTYNDIGSNGVNRCLVNPSPGNGYFSGNRISSTDHRLFFANSGSAHAQVGNLDNTAFSAYPNFPAFLMGYNGSGTPILSSDTISYVAFHDGLTLAQSAAQFSAVQTYLSARGGGFV